MNKPTPSYARIILDIFISVKEWTERHPAPLFGLSVLGFMTGFGTFIGQLPSYSAEYRIEGILVMSISVILSIMLLKELFQSNNTGVDE